VGLDLLPPPPAIGAPEHFSDWRAHQPPAILKATDTEKRFVAMVLPTGSGKSLTVVGASLLAGWRCAILTSTKLLQHQYTDDFSEIGMVDVRGMNAYPCVAFKDEHMQYAEPSRWQSCEEGPCHAGNGCSRKPTNHNPDASGCHYYDAVARARDARLVVTNYKFWLSQHYFGKGLGNFDCLVLDEAHNAPQELADFLSTELTNKDIEGTLQAAWPNELHDVAAWGAWAKREGARVERQLETWKPRSKMEMNRFRLLKAVSRKLVILSTLNATDWVMTEDNGVWHFDPIWVKDHKETLFVQTPRVILTSATFNAKTAEMLGLNPAEDMEWHEAESDFPVERRPVYYVPTVKVDFRTTPSDERQLIVKHDQIVRARQDRKGITHTVSYKRRNMLLEGSEFRDRMVIHDSRTAKSAVEQFKSAEPGALLVSPSMTTGYDFPDSQCEYQIILKIPFPDSRSPVVKARTAADKDYPAYIAMQELVQAVGRAMRSRDDQAEAFILDDNCAWFMSKYKHFAPKWFLQAYRRVNTLPTPPPALESA
jgi:ATP-dependent DNA helicase DinG